MDSDSTMNGGNGFEKRQRAVLKKRPRRPEAADRSTVESISKKLTEAGCFVVVAESRGRNSLGVTMELEGGFKEFAECAQQLGIRVVFLEASVFDEEEFYSDYDSDDDDDDDDEGLVDLRTVEPKLRRFEDHLGSSSHVTAVGCFGNNCISHTEAADWFEEFVSLRDRVLAKVDTSAGERQEQRRREMEQRRNGAVRAIRALATDPEFKRTVGGGRATLQSIMAYVRENIEDARYLMQGALRDEVRTLKDKLLLSK